MFQHFSTNLRFYRLSQQHTQETMSHLLNISRQTYSHYETGYRTPDLETFYSISCILNVPMECFFLEPSSEAYITRQELLVYLQDFCRLSPETRQQILDLIRKNPN